MDPATQMRQQAAKLRRSANALMNSSTFVLPQRSGDDVWIGPTAGHFGNDLQEILAKLRSAADSLTSTAAKFDARAELVVAKPVSGLPK